MRTSANTRLNSIETAVSWGDSHRGVAGDGANVRERIRDKTNILIVRTYWYVQMFSLPSFVFKRWLHTSAGLALSLCENQLDRAAKKSGQIGFD